MKKVKHPNQCENGGELNDGKSLTIPVPFGSRLSADERLRAILKAQTYQRMLADVDDDDFDEDPDDMLSPAEIAGLGLSPSPAAPQKRESAPEGPKVTSSDEQPKKGAKKRPDVVDQNGKSLDEEQA